LLHWYDNVHVCSLCFLGIVTVLLSSCLALPVCWLSVVDGGQPLLLLVSLVGCVTSVFSITVMISGLAISYTHSSCFSEDDGIVIYQTQYLFAGYAI